MSDPINPPPPTPAPNTPPPPPLVSPELIAAIGSTIDTRLNAFSAQFKAPPPPPPPPADPAALTKDQRIAVLEQREADRAAETLRSTRSSAIESAFSADAVTGYPAAAVTALKAVLETSHGKHITVEEGKTFYTSPETGKIPIAQFVAQNFLKSEIALGLKPPSSMPGGAAMANGKAPAAPTGTHEYSGKTYAEIMALTRTAPAKAFKYMEENAAEFEAKQRQHYTR